MCNNNNSNKFANCYRINKKDVVNTNKNYITLFQLQKILNQYEIDTKQCEIDTKPFFLPNKITTRFN